MFNTCCDEVVVWGHTVIGDYIYREIRNKYPDKTIIMCDNDEKKQTVFDNSMVVSLDEAIKCYPNALYVITSYAHEKIMREELAVKGIKPDWIVYGVTGDAEKYASNVEKEKKHRPLEKLQFEIDIAMHCNLDCNCCSQFAALAKPEYVDIEQMERDFERLGSLFNGEAERIYLIGGEPLLYKDITKCINIARRYFAKGTISIFTNGLLLWKMDESFWDACRGNDVGIIVTRYPINIDYYALENYVKEHGVKFELFGTSRNFKYMSNVGLDTDGTQDIEESFEHCAEANNCIKLRDGKLFTCTRPAAIYKFNSYFGTSLEVSENDYIDIYKAESGKEILDFLSKPIPFCRYCNTVKHRVAREWAHSNRSIDEWS